MKTLCTTLLTLTAVFTSLEAQTPSDRGAAGGILTTQDQNTSLNSALAVVSQPITFEGWPDGTILTTQYQNVNFHGAVVLTAASAGGSLDNASYPPRSGNNVIYNPNGPLTLTFSSPVNFVSGYFTYANGLVMQAYDSSKDLLATTQGAYLYNWVDPSDPTANPPSNELVGITLTSPSISTLVISSVDNTLGFGAFVADDISFTGSGGLNPVPAGNPVPEPSGMILLGAVFLAGVYRYGIRGIRGRHRLHSPAS